MYKIIAFFVTFSISHTIHTQNSNNQICGEVSFTQTTHFSRDFSRKFVLNFNQNFSLYTEVDIVKTNKNTTTSTTDEGAQLNIDIARNNTTPEFYFNNREELYFREIKSDQELVAKEDPFKWKWKLKNETKKIGDFECEKGIITFRGRVYTAWFTKLIPVSYGPWKFQGLPGLILEIYDEDKVFHIVASRVKINSTSNCELSFDKTKLKNALTIQDYLVKKTDIIKADFAKISSKLPKGSNPLIYDENCDDCREEIEKF